MTQSKYAYCFVGVDSEETEGQSVGTGVEDEPAYVHVADGLGAVVHDCSPKAYDTDDREQAEEWVTQHNNTIERAASEFGSVLPMTFDTIFESEEGVRDFLTMYNDQITTRLEILAGTEEYGIRIYCEEELLVDGTEASTDTGGTGGMEYFEEMKQEEKRKAEMAESMKERFQEYFRRINAVVDEITEGDLEDDDDRGRNVLTASCLVDEAQTAGLKTELGEINDQKGVEVVFTGPWLPYTFVGSLGEEAPEAQQMEPEDDSVEEGIAGLLDRALTKGAILNADLLITVNDVPLVGIRLQAAIANMETMVKYGIMTDWDPAIRHVDDEYLAEHTLTEDNDDTETTGETRSSDDKEEKIIE